MHHYFVQRDGPGRPDVRVWGLRIEAPDDYVDGRSVKEFFWNLTCDMRHREGQGQQIDSVGITVGSVEGVSPPSRFVGDLCRFLRNHPFVVAGNRTFLKPLALMVELAADVEAVDDEDVVLASRSDPIVHEVTDRICLSLRENERMCAAEFMYVALPVLPTGDALNLFFTEGDDGNEEGTEDDDDSERGTRVLINVKGDPAGRVSDELQIQWGDAVTIFTQGSVYVARVAKQVLRSPSPSPSQVHPTLTFRLTSSVAVGAVVECLKEVQNYPLASIDFVSVAINEEPPPALDGAGIIGVVLRCPSMTNLFFRGFEFSLSSFAAAEDALARPLPSLIDGPASTSALRFLSFDNCNFPDPTTGPVELAQSMSPNRKLWGFELSCPRVVESDIKSLCAALTESDWELENLWVDEMPDLEADHVEQFFRNLPSMKTLNGLTFNYEASASLFNVIVNGFKTNYGITDVDGLSFAGDPEVASWIPREIMAYVVANASGRTTVHRAISNPNDHRLHEEAIDVLHRLSSSDDPDDATSLFLCLQLFLPSLEARGGTGGVPSLTAPAQEP